MRWRAYFPFAMIVVAGLAVLASSGTVRAQNAGLVKATQLFEDTDNMLDGALMQAARANCITPDGRAAMSHLVNSVNAQLDNIASQYPTSGYPNGRPGPPSLGAANVPATVAFYKERLSSTLARLIAFPTCVPPPPPQLVQPGPSGGPPVGGGGGGGSGGGEPPPPVGGEPGPQPREPGQIDGKQKASLRCATRDELKRIQEIQQRIAADQAQLSGIEQQEATAQDKADALRNQDFERRKAGGEVSSADQDLINQLDNEALQLRQQDQPLKDQLNEEINSLDQDLQDLLDAIGARKRCPEPDNDEHSSLLKDIFGHVSIGVGVGVGGGGHDHGDRSGDRGSDSGPSTPHD